MKTTPTGFRKFFRVHVSRLARRSFRLVLADAGTTSGSRRYVAHTNRKATPHNLLTGWLLQVMRSGPRSVIVRFAQNLTSANSRRALKILGLIPKNTEKKEFFFGPAQPKKSLKTNNIRKFLRETNPSEPEFSFHYSRRRPNLHRRGAPSLS